MRKVKMPDMYRKGQEVEISEEQSINELQAGWSLYDILHLVPTKLFCAVLLTIVLVAEYYWRHCIWSRSQGFVSKPMYTPRSTNLDLWSAFFPNLFQAEREEEPYWRWS